MGWVDRVLAAITALFAIIPYVDPDRKLLKMIQIPGLDVSHLPLALISYLCFLALVVLGLRRVAKLEQRWEPLRRHEETRHEAWLREEHQDIVKQLDDFAAAATANIHGWRTRHEDRIAALEASQHDHTG